MAAVDGLHARAGTRVVVAGCATRFQDVEPLVVARRAAWTVAPSLSALDAGRVARVAALVAEGAATTSRTEASVRIRTTAEKAEVLDQATSFARARGASAGASARLAAAVEELVSNALYDAPVDANGARRFATRARTEPVELAADEAVEVELASDGGSLAAKVRDPFGSIRDAEVYAGLARGFGTASRPRAAPSAGAGLGLPYALGLVEELVIESQPGRKTEVTARVDLGSHAFARTLVVRIQGAPGEATTHRERTGT